MAEKQRTNLRAGRDVLRDIGVRWAISIDCDELIYCEKSVSAALSKLPESIDLAKIWPAEAVLHPEMSSDRGILNSVH